MKVNNRSHRYNINRSTPKLGHKYTKYKVSSYNNAYMYQATLKQHLNLSS